MFEWDERELEEMPFDHEFGGKLLHATGKEVFHLGQWWNEYYDPETDSYEYGR